MSENYNIDIISPEEVILSAKVNSVTIPSFEGEMTILSDHIPLITFLRPGIIKILGDKTRYLKLLNLSLKNSLFFS